MATLVIRERSFSHSCLERATCPCTGKSKVDRKVHLHLLHRWVNVLFEVEKAKGPSMTEQQYYFQSGTKCIYSQMESFVLLKELSFKVR